MSVIGSAFKFPRSVLQLPRTVGIMVTLPRQQGQGGPGLTWPARGVWIESAVFSIAVDGFVFSRAVGGWGSLKLWVVWGSLKLWMVLVKCLCLTIVSRVHTLCVFSSFSYCDVSNRVP